MNVDIILTANGVRNNLLNCNIKFGNGSLENLKRRIENATPSEQILIYADFLKTNINTFLSL